MCMHVGNQQQIPCYAPHVSTVCQPNATTHDHISQAFPLHLNDQSQEEGMAWEQGYITTRL